MPTLSLPEITLHYEEDGSGTPVLLIAGFGSDSASWLPLMPFMGEGLRLIRPDNRTCGRTEPKDAPTDMGRYVADCVALLDHLGIDRAHVVGHSMGGLIGMQMATDAPARVASLSLLAIAPMVSPRNVVIFEAMIAIRRSNAPPDTWLRAFFPWLFARKVFENPAAIEAAIAMGAAYPHAQPVDAMERQLAALGGYDPTHVDVTCPVQAILGQEDLLVPEGPARAALASLPGIEIDAIADAAHSVHWEAPEGVAQSLRGFFAAQPL